MSGVTYSGTLAGSDGSTLAVSGAVLTPAPVGPPPPPPPPPPPVGTRRRVAWHQGWSGPPLSSWPVDVRASVTCVILAMAQSAASGTGKLTMPPGVSRADVLALTSAGVDVLVGVGGAGDGGISVTNDAQVGQVVTSALGFRDALGTTGICWDLEGAPGSGWTSSAVIQADQQLIAAGQQVAIWSALYGGRLAGWGAVAQALGDQLHHWQRGFYDFGEANDSRLSGIVTSSSTGLAAMRPFVASEQQLVASFAPVGSTSRTPVAVAAAAYAAARAKYPGAGWSVWEDHQDSGAGWTTTRALAAL